MNILFLIEFRLVVCAIFLFLGFPIQMIVASFTEIENKSTYLVGGIVLFIGWLLSWKYLILPKVYPIAFGKLILTDEGVEYRCLFKKRSFISWDDCEFCGIEAYPSVTTDLYKIGYRYVYFSTKQIPEERRNKPDYMKNDNELIKFYPVTKKLCNEILLHKSASDIRRALFQNEIKW